jgi:hypothetical protein
MVIWEIAHADLMTADGYKGVELLRYEGHVLEGALSHSAEHVRRRTLLNFPESQIWCC